MPKLSPKQLEVWNDYHRCLLVCGPRKSSKSIAIEHKVMKHLWENPGARFALFSKSVKSAKDGGVWNDFIDIILPEWLNSGMVGETGLPIAFTSQTGSGEPGPRIDGTTRTSSFKIRNYYGGESELMLFSLDTDEQVEAKIKQLRFSGMWFIELSNFKIRKVLEISVLSLRMVHLKYEAHQWFADCNPAEEGEDSWIYKTWYQERIQKDHPKPDFQKGLGLIEIFLADNPFLDPREVSELEGLYSSDPGEYDRNVLGKWTKGHGNIGKHFSDLIIPEIHFVEDSIDLASSTIELFTGWDLGSVNHAACILERRFIKEVAHWMVLEELVVIGDHVSTSEFAYEFYEKMLAIEAFYGKTFIWKHWSDDTAINVYRPGIDGYDAAEVLKATNGKVDLEGVDKPDGSVKESIRMIRRMIRENRLFVGKNCPRTIDMLLELKQGGTKPVDDTEYKHPFDALRYPIYMESREELQMFSRPSSSKRSGIITIS